VTRHCAVLANDAAVPQPPHAFVRFPDDGRTSLSHNAAKHALRGVALVAPAADLGMPPGTGRSAPCRDDRRRPTADPYLASVELRFMSLALRQGAEGLAQGGDQSARLVFVL